MSVGSQQYAVTGTASVIASVPPLTGSVGGGQVGAVIVTTSANVFLGGANVTSTNGLGITSTSAPLTVPLFPGDVLYAVAATTATVSVLQT